MSLITPADTRLRGYSPVKNEDTFVLHSMYSNSEILCHLNEASGLHPIKWILCLDWFSSHASSAAGALYANSY